MQHDLLYADFAVNSTVGPASCDIESGKQWHQVRYPSLVLCSQPARDQAGQQARR